MVAVSLWLPPALSSDLTSAVGVGGPESDLCPLLSPREICRLVRLLLLPVEVWMSKSPAASTSLALELPVIPMGAEMRLLVST